MAPCIKLTSLSTKQLTIICSLIATVITIGVVVTITIRNGSPNLQESNIQEYALKIQSTEPQWIQFVDEATSLVNAFNAGTNDHSEPIYVCRVNLGDQILPGTYSSNQASCQVTYDYFIHGHKEFEILIAEDHSIFVWQDVNSYDDNVSNGALIGGISASKYDIKIAKVGRKDDERIGRVDWTTKEALAPIGQYEHKFREYQVLCLYDYSLL
ncbi:uncharacterized protein LOC107365858 isoform X1 [Tetranychus urticae]|uniref:Uncharacterized protein n=1 Tax=Tetranychus urticae TaxID=32264 RepID=T1KNQ8_TETUR|nr:uncharacterized protein LOC107365858 isoform X1 [Tetranychus urticae]